MALTITRCIKAGGQGFNEIGTSDSLQAFETSQQNTVDLFLHMQYYDDNTLKLAVYSLITGK